MIVGMETVDTATTKTSPITLSDNAVAKLAALMADETEPQALRIAVTGGGCSGFQYALGFDTEQHSDDLVYEQGGVRVIVDETSAGYLNGAVVDFQDGLNGKGFAIENPNSTGSCGCGQSFSC
ncbi:MAG: iron-sulfur cluster assembly accessory protein [Thermoleophilia bacterium]|nr:iron-sulfur cluster assembly accessory protein [Thermoleophilia bacterium]